MRCVLKRGDHYYAGEVAGDWKDKLSPDIADAVVFTVRVVPSDREAGGLEIAGDPPLPLRGEWTLVPVALTERRVTPC